MKKGNFNSRNESILTISINLDYLNKINIAKLFLVWLSLFVFFASNAQNASNIPLYYKDKITKADNNFNLLNYAEAIDLYKEVLVKIPGDTSIICKIANSYRLSNKPADAEEWYKMAVVSHENTISPVYILQLAQVLSNNTKYQEALYWYKQYSNLNPADIRAIESIKSLENISGLYRDSVFYTAYPLSVNTKHSELGPRLFKGELMFLSDRNDQKFGMISRYSAQKDSTGDFSNPTKFQSGVKAEFNEGVVSFYDNNRQVIFCQNVLADSVKKKQGSTAPFKLFTAKCDSSVWYDIKMLPFQKNEFAYAQPCISENGKFLFFTSDMPDGQGGSDIYMITNTNGEWGQPVNLGYPINTSGDEIFPFIFRDSILYFSSNGHGGLGEQDIFKINLNDPSSLKNMGLPINSSFDDFGIVVTEDGLNGYYASNRNNDLTGDDIFGFKQIRMSIKVKVIDEITGIPVSHAKINYSDGNIVSDKATTDQDGNLELIVPVEGNSELSVKKDNYEPVTVAVNNMNYYQESKSVLPLKIKNNDPISEKMFLTDESGNILNNSSEIIYKIQVMASRRLATQQELEQKYKGNFQVEKAFEDEWYKYTIGEYKSFNEAHKVLKETNVSDSFIAAYLNNKRVYIKFAKETAMETSN